jgi:hypothetical protein
VQDSVKEYFELAEASGDLIIAINRKKYAAAIADAAYIIQIISEEMHEKLKLEGALESSGRCFICFWKKKPAKNKIKDDMLAWRVRTRQLFKYGTFMAAVAAAKDADEVEEAIENFALPSGSSRIKRETPFNVSLNAYCGLFGGYEKIVGVATDRPFRISQAFEQFNSYGLTAPIGVAVNFGQFRRVVFGKGNGHWSHSLFVSLLDVGAVAAFRSQSSNDSVKQIPSIQLKDIISPGAFWSIGIPKTPISLNLGVQVGPNLRAVSSKTNDYSDNLYWRYSASLCVDIPVLNFYTKASQK